jgi:hypothetical protein
MGYAGPRQFIRLPYSTCSPHLAPSASHLEHIAPIFPNGASSSYMAPSTSQMATFGFHVVPTAPYSDSSYVAPMQWMQLSYSAYTQLPYGPVWCMWLLYGSCSPIGCMELLYGGIDLPYGSIRLPHGTRGSHTAHTNPIWPHLGAMQLSYGANCLPYGTIWLPNGSHMAHMAPAWCTWLPHGPHMVHVAPIWHHLPPIWCTQHTYSAQSSHMVLICHMWLPHSAI